MVRKEYIMSDTIKTIPHFKFWCQKVLPLVYDDSLSYYELLCKVVEYLNGVISDINAVPDYIYELIKSEDFYKDVINQLMNTLREQIATINEHKNETASADRYEGELLWLDETLVKMTRNILAGDRYVEDTGEQGVTGNYVKTTVETELDSLKTLIEEEIGDLSTLLTTDKSDIVSAINEVYENVQGVIEDISNEVSAREDADTTLQGHIDDEATAREDADTTLQGHIDDEATAREQADNEIIGMLDNIDVNHVYNEALPTDNITTNIGLKEGTYTITEDTTINAQLVVPKGALININEGITLTINGQILAGRYQIFGGSGSVVVNKSYQNYGYPEWFGGFADNTTDCTTAIQKCLDTFVVTLLGSGTYKTSDTLVINKQSHSLIGCSSYRSTNGSRIILNSSTGAVIRVGLDSEPSSLSANLSGVTVKGIEIGHSSSDFASGTSACGIVTQFLLKCNFENLILINNGCGIRITRSIACNFEKLHIFSETLQSGDTNRTFMGIFIDASLVANTLANASLYFHEIMVTTGGVKYANSYGIRGYGSGSLSDINISQCEINTVAYGISLWGSNNATSTLDIIIANNVIDSVAVFGIEVQNMNRGQLTFTGNYIALSSNITPSTQSGIYCNNVSLINITNNQIIGIIADGENPVGINLNACYDSVITGNTIKDFKLPMMCTSCYRDEFRNTINNYVVNVNNVACVSLTTVVGCTLNDHICIATASGTTSGAYVGDASTTKNEINVTGIYKTARMTNALVLNGVAVTTTGTSNGNLVSGLFITS